MRKSSLERAMFQSVNKSEKNSASLTEKPFFSSEAGHLAKAMLGEECAAAYLKERGLKLLGRNIRVGHCEIDIVARDNDEIVFVEVRTRSSGWMMSASESVGPKKIANLIKAGCRWSEDRNYCGFWRIDLVAVTLEEGKEPAVEHIRNITEPISK